jgi:hypothetical protein
MPQSIASAAPPHPDTIPDIAVSTHLDRSWVVDDDADNRAEPAFQAGFTWGDFVDDLVRREGSLTAVAEKLAASRSFEDDVLSVERALRRLRSRGQRAGGKWGARALATFGLPSSIRSRLRWMASYHSRFTDLPVSVCDDLVKLWDHPPATERKEERVWLAIARATIALRRTDFDGASKELERAERDITAAPAAACCEAMLARAYIASRNDLARVAGMLAEIEPWLARVDDDEERACLHARWIDQRAYEINKRKNGSLEEAAALYERIPIEGAPPFALFRRANGLAYARWKLGHAEEAAALAREAAEHAGDGGHVRLRAMALSMLARIVKGSEGEDARRRAVEISCRLEDETLLARFTRPSGTSSDRQGASRSSKGSTPIRRSGA